MFGPCRRSGWLEETSSLSLGSAVSWRIGGGSDRLQSRERHAGTACGNEAEPQLGVSWLSLGPGPGPLPVLLPEDDQDNSQGQRAAFMTVIVLLML